MGTQLMLLVDPATSLITEGSSEIEAWLGLKPGSLPGRPLSQLLRDPSREDLAGALAVTVRRPEVRQLRVRFETAAGRRANLDVQLSASPDGRALALFRFTLSAEQLAELPLPLSA